jgi:hypothetical protein
VASERNTLSFHSPTLFDNWPALGRRGHLASEGGRRWREMLSRLGTGVRQIENQSVSAIYAADGQSTYRCTILIPECITGRGTGAARPLRLPLST